MKNKLIFGIGILSLILLVISCSLNKQEEDQEQIEIIKNDLKSSFKKGEISNTFPRYEALSEEQKEDHFLSNEALRRVIELHTIYQVLDEDEDYDPDVRDCIILTFYPEDSQYWNRMLEPLLPRLFAQPGFFDCVLPDSTQGSISGYEYKEQLISCIKRLNEFVQDSPNSPADTHRECIGAIDPLKEKAYLALAKTYCDSEYLQQIFDPHIQEAYKEIKKSDTDVMNQ